MGKYYITTEFLYRSSTEILADSAEEAKEKWEKMSLKQIVGKDIINIGDLEDGLIVDIDEEKTSKV